MHQFTCLLRLRLCGHQQREDAGPAPVACTHPCGYYDLVSLTQKANKIPSDASMRACGCCHLQQLVEENKHNRETSFTHRLYT